MAFPAVIGIVACFFFLNDSPTPCFFCHAMERWTKASERVTMGRLGAATARSNYPHRGN